VALFMSLQRGKEAVPFLLPLLAGQAVPAPFRHRYPGTYRNSRAGELVVRRLVVIAGKPFCLGGFVLSRNDLTAFDLYTRARNIFLAATNSNSGKEDLLEAADLLNQALTRDPSYFEAYCQLGGIHDLLYILGHDHSPRRLTLAEAMPEWSGYCLAGQQGKEEWDRFFAALQAHEQGHIELVAQELAPCRRGACRQVCRGCSARVAVCSRRSIVSEPRV
jgi:Bacterial protein of unknown function (DUF922)